MITASNHEVNDMAFFTKKKAAAGATPGEILSALSSVMDPDLGKDLVTLNMIRNVEVADGAVALDLVLTTPPGLGAMPTPVRSDISSGALDPGNRIS